MSRERKRDTGWKQAGALLCAVLTACASSRGLTPREELEPVPPQMEWCEADVLQPSPSTHPIPLAAGDVQRALRGLAASWRLTGTPSQTAHDWLQAPMELEEEWLAEVYRGRVLTLAPRREHTALNSQADAALRRDYAQWCESHGGGDCLGLLDDGPSLRTDDRRTLALALALGTVLEETRGALAHEFHPRALLSLLVWTVSLYAMAWVVPEPTLKAVAASITLVLVGWLGVETVWSLMDGWAELATQAHAATTFEELRQAGATYAQILGTNAARALILAAGAVAGRLGSEVAAQVRSLPGYSLANMQWQAQGGSALLGRLQVEGIAHEGALATAVATVETVLASPQGPLAVVLLKRKAVGGSGPGGRLATTVIRHRGGNQQVLLGNGQRWHLPRGKSLRDIPTQDKVGDQLQEAVTRAANQWGPDKLSRSEQFAIDNALKEGKHWLARLLEREARGRFVEKQVKAQFNLLFDWFPQGVDIIDPATGLKYEILSGTESNLARHGRRMADELFRMLTF